jgi:hypothetical protein
VLQLFTTDEFAQWFGALGDADAEDVATALEVVERIGPARAAPGSRESLLWYEHPSVSRFEAPWSLARYLEAWGSVRDYVKRVLEELESARFVSRVARLPSAQVDSVLKSIKQIKRAADPRVSWVLRAKGVTGPIGSVRPEDACAEMRRMYFCVLEAAGFTLVDVPEHSLALREFSLRLPAPGFRLLYGVNVQREMALFVLGEKLDRSFYGDSVRHAEAMWKQFLEGHLQAVQPAQFR